MATVYLALGSNVGDSRQEIEQAIGLLGAAVNNIQRAPLYRTKAAGYTDQPDFINTAIRGETALSPGELLALAQDIEQKIGRIERFRWGPREIDIDIIFYGDLVQESEALVLPHPVYHKRDFVLQPLKDLDPNLRDPVSGKTVSELLAKIAPQDKSITGIAGTVESVD